MKMALLVAGILLTGLVIALSMLHLSDPTPDDFQVDRELFPYQPHYLQTNNGARVHYVDEGQGPTLLLLHGNPTWSFLYRDLIAELKDDFRLIAPDYPGFGLSTAPENYRFTPAEHARVISELVQQLDLTDVVIMVQDWGGPIGFLITNETQLLSHRPLHTVSQATSRGHSRGEESGPVSKGSEFGSLSQGFRHRGSLRRGAVSLALAARIRVPGVRAHGRVCAASHP